MTQSNVAEWQPHLTLELKPEPPPLKPRDHQLAAWDAMTKHFLDQKKRAGLIVVPTGGGKTVMAAHWLLEHHVRDGGRVLWLAHRRSLIRQAMRTFRNHGNVAFPKEKLALLSISSIDAKWTNVDPCHDVVFASIQSAVLEGNIGSVELLAADSTKRLFVVVDEAHHAAAPGYTRLLKLLASHDTSLLGLTATPVRMSEDEQRRLSALFDNTTVYQITRRRLTEEGILAAPSFETVETKVNLERDFTPADLKHLERFGEIGPAVLARLANHAGRNKLIVEHYVKNKDRFGSTIVFAADTLHAATLADQFKKSGIDADHVDYSRKDAQKIIQRYQDERKPDVIVNVEMLTEGFDAPHTKTVFIARPTQSHVLLTQMVGRALRGTKSNGNDIAYLVTFLDTWEQFQVLDAKYELADPEDVPIKPTKDGEPVPVVIIPPELIKEAYQLLQSNTRGQFVGVYQCLPHGWYAWEEMFEDDLQRRSVMIFENQVETIESLLSSYPTPESVPTEVDEDLARSLIRKFFVDVPDPLPRWADIKALLDAKRKGCEIIKFTFDDKAQFDPVRIARQVVDEDLTSSGKTRLLEAIWTDSPACRLSYRGNQQAFREDVDREEQKIVTKAPEPTLPEIVNVVPTTPPRGWPEGERGYSLIELRDAVLSVRKHFPNGPPTIGALLWTTRADLSYWGFYRYSDKAISANCVLNSPDIPLFVAEFLMYHEMLHADMPSVGHNQDFKERERKFEPSAKAISDAAARGINAGTTRHYWYVRAATFLDTFERHFAAKRPGTAMEI